MPGSHHKGATENSHVCQAVTLLNCHSAHYSILLFGDLGKAKECLVDPGKWAVTTVLKCCYDVGIPCARPVQHPFCWPDAILLPMSGQSCLEAWTPVLAF